MPGTADGRHRNDNVAFGVAAEGNQVMGKGNLPEWFPLTIWSVAVIRNFHLWRLSGRRAGHPPFITSVMDNESITR